MNHFAELARRPKRPPRADLVIAGAMSVWVILEVIFLDGPGPAWVRLIAGLGMTVPLVWRRIFPLEVLLAVVGVLLVRSLAGSESEDGASFFVSVLIATFSASAYADRPRLVLAAGAFAVLGCIASMLLGFASSETSEPKAADVLIIALFTSGAWIAGWVLNRRVAQSDRLLKESDEMAREAVVDERARIARELHDIVAHSISVISIQAGAAEQYLERDPGKARHHLESVQTSAHDALNEMRRLTGVLREDQPGYRPQPGLNRLEDLAEASRGGGLGVEIVEYGERPELPPGVDLAVYRVIQEALTNALKHAGRVSATVTITYRENEVEVEIVNAAGPGGEGGGSGHGLVGMRERVRVYDGRLETGPAADGGFRVFMCLPLGDQS